MKRKAGILFFLRLLKMALSVFNLSLSAKYFGVSIERDIWILTLNCIVVVDLAIWGPINETFRAKFIFLRESIGLTTALNGVKSLLVLTLIVTSLIVGVILFVPSVLGKVIAPTYKGVDLDALLLMIVILAPTLLFNQINQISTSILNAYDSFFIPEIASFISILLNLFLLLFLAPIIGIYSLVVAYYIGLLLLFIMLMAQIKKLDIPLFSGYRFIKLKDSKPFILFAIPFFVPYFFGQVSLVVEKSIASSLGIGTVSIMDYAKKFSEISISVLGSVFTTMLVPILSLKFASKKPKEFVYEFMQLYQLGFLLIILIVSCLTIMPNAIVTILYNKGQMDILSLERISVMITYYGWSIIGVFSYLIFGMALLSSQRGKIYAFYGVLAQVLMILINLFGSRYLGIIVFPLSLFISHSIAAIFMISKFPYKTAKMLIVSLKYLLLFIVTVGLSYLVNFRGLLPKNAFLALITGAGGISVFLLMELFIFRFEERFIVLKYLRQFKGMLKR